MKSSSHWRAFETAFEVYFSLRGPGYGSRRASPTASWTARATASRTGRPGPATAGRAGRAEWQGGGGGEGMTPEELAEMLFKALLAADDAMMTVVARHAVDRYAGMEPGRPVGGTYYLYRTLRNLDLDGRPGQAARPGPGRGGRRDRG